ncbi:MAG: tetratricopeptide repeat protein [Proteobacteria bacterium]|nr:tetratricopeptide repeat protein [Pseudomonadota bacterium]
MRRQGGARKGMIRTVTDWSERRGLLLVLGVTAAAFALSLGFGWVYDDFPVIVENESLVAPGALGRAFTTNVWAFAPELAEPRYYRPLFTVWIILNRLAFGTEPAAWHATTVALHMGAVAVLWHLLRKVTGSAFAATTGALLFAIHPTRAESVGWVCGLTDPMAALVGFGAVLAHVHDRKAAAAGLFAMALLTKETAILFGAFPVLIAWEQRRWRDGWKVGISWAVIAAAYLGIRHAVIGQVAPTLQSGAGVAVVIDLVGAYTQHLLVPWRQAITYPLPPAAGWALAGVAIFAAGSLTAGPARVWFWMGGLFLLPVLNVSVLQPDMMMQDRYLYLPSACWYGALGWGAAQAWGRRPGPAVPAVVGAVAVAYVAGLSVNLPHWADNRSVWERAIEVHPTHARSWFNLGVDYENAGDLRLAEAHYQRAVELQPRRAIFHFRLAFMYAERQQLELARDHFVRASELRPEDAAMRYEADRIQQYLRDRKE